MVQYLGVHGRAHEIVGQFVFHKSNRPRLLISSLKQHTNKSFRNLVSKTPQAFRNLVSKTPQAFWNLVSKTPQAFRNLVSKISQAFRNLVSKTPQAFRNLSLVRQLQKLRVSGNVVYRVEATTNLFFARLMH